MCSRLIDKDKLITIPYRLPSFPHKPELMRLLYSTTLDGFSRPLIALKYSIDRGTRYIGTEFVLYKVLHLIEVGSRAVANIGKQFLSLTLSARTTTHNIIHHEPAPLQLLVLLAGRYGSCEVDIESHIGPY